MQILHLEKKKDPHIAAGILQYEMNQNSFHKYKGNTKNTFKNFKGK